MKIAYFTNIAPHYRNCLWQKLANKKEFEFHFFFGRTSHSGIKEIDPKTQEWAPYNHRMHNLKNVRIRGLVVWQFGTIKQAFSNEWDAFVYLGDMFILSTWIAAVIVKFRHKPVFFWGHGMYGDENKIKMFFRRLFLGLAQEHFLYNNHSKEIMMKNGFLAQNLFVIYNSLDYDKHLLLRKNSIDEDFYMISDFFSNSSYPILIFIGRLIPGKRIDLLVQSVIELNDEGLFVNLILVGDGPMLTKLKILSERVSGKGKVYFYGPCYDEKEIGKLLSNASICVSPGNVGLTAIHSLSFGTPVITQNNTSKQSPEYEAIEPGVTGAFFEENDLDSLKKVISEWITNHPQKEKGLRDACYKQIDNFYNPYYQLGVFERALQIVQ